MTEEGEMKDDLSADLAAAWDAVEAHDEPDSEVPESLEAESDAPEGEHREHEPEVQPEGKPSGVHAAAEQESAAAPDEVPSLDKPPAGLSPEAREAWKETPEAVRKDIARREADYARGIEKHRANTERVRAMDQTLAPYQNFFEQNGGAAQVLPGLLQAGATLQMGTDVQKAEMVANLVKTFGVSVQKLDQLLVGEKPTLTEEERLNEMLNQKLTPLQQKLRHYEERDRQAQQAQQAQVQGEVQQFASKAEFYSDVRAEMADLMEMAANRGRQMSLQEAYDIACSTHPSISRIIANRKSQEQVASKRNAASSVHGSPGTDSFASTHDTRRQAIMDSWDNAGRM